MIWRDPYYNIRSPYFQYQRYVPAMPGYIAFKSNQEIANKIYNAVKEGSEDSKNKALQILYTVQKVKGRYSADIDEIINILKGLAQADKKIQGIIGSLPRNLDNLADKGFPLKADSEIYKKIINDLSVICKEGDYSIYLCAPKKEEHPTIDEVLNDSELLILYKLEKSGRSFYRTENDELKAVNCDGKSSVSNVMREVNKFVNKDFVNYYQAEYHDEKGKPCFMIK